MTDRLIAIDRRLVKTIGSIRILATLAWPDSAKDRFLASWRARCPALPAVVLQPVNHDSERAALDGLISELDAAHPVEEVLIHNARSWQLAAEMLASVGTPRFTECSLELYGSPSDRMHEGAPSNLDAARFFLDHTEGLLGRDPGGTLPAEDAARWLQERIEPVIPDHPVVPTEDLSARATGGSRRVRLRAGAIYPYTELEQLLQHEAFVHSATARNGRAQPILGSLAWGSPRTTCTQEGLATFAELITDAMDIQRLRRIALRVEAVHAALEGADFIEVFELFLDGGQGEEEAVESAYRVFRGGDVNGGACFTKDSVYLKGTLLTHAFLLAAQKAGRGSLARMLFVGRLTWDDAVALEPFLGGLVAPAQHLPSWARNDARLAAFLVWSILHRRLDLSALELGHFDSGVRG